MNVLSPFAALASNGAPVKDVEFLSGMVNSGIGFAWNNLRQGFASILAHRVAWLRRALSVAIPVLAYICRYSFEMNRKASRALKFGVQLDRFQMAAKP